MTGDVSKECAVTALASQPGSPNVIWTAREDKCLMAIDVRSNVVEVSTGSHSLKSIGVAFRTSVTVNMSSSVVVLRRLRASIELHMSLRSE